MSEEINHEAARQWAETVAEDDRGDGLGLPLLASANLARAYLDARALAERWRDDAVEQVDIRGFDIEKMKRKLPWETDK